MVLDVDLSYRLKYVFQHDWVDYGTTNTSRGVNQYLFYTINDCWSFGTRFEWWQTKTLAAAGAAAPDFSASDLYNVTAGLNWRPQANITVRPEVRWDKDRNGVLIGASRNEKVGFGMDMIVTY